jgi:hypothetical protein
MTKTNHPNTATREREREETGWKRGCCIPLRGNYRPEERGGRLAAAK